MKLAVTVLFDQSYIEPALLTAYELIRCASRIDKIYLLLLSSEDPDDVDAQEILAEFVEKFNGHIKVSAVHIKNTLQGFQKFHFNNSIIYKALIPSAIPHEHYILNLDAGFLLGQRFNRFLESMIESHQSDTNDWIISAHCINPEENLSLELAGMPHNTLYPAGGLLLFNCKNYSNQGWFRRYTKNFELLSSRLTYAEQELICLTADGGELRTLGLMDEVHTKQLSNAVLEGRQAPLQYGETDDCALFKFTGSFKPWKYWVLDPDKRLYSIRRAALESEFQLTGIPLIEKHREHATRPDWIRAFQQSYERHILRDPRSTM